MIMNATFNYDKELLKKLKNNYFMTKALYETIKEEAYEIQKRILEENEFYEEEETAKKLGERRGDDKPRRILDPDQSYMMVEDKDNFYKYLDLCYAEYVKAGIADKRGRDYIPEAESKDLYRKARKQLIDYGIDIVPDGYPEKETLRQAVRNIKWGDKVLDLVLSLEC
jgi:hypothetical protein